MKPQGRWKKRLLFAGFALLLATGCHAPQEYIKARSDSGKIIFRVQPQDARVSVDGDPVGLARDFSGRPVILEVPAGVHQIELRRDGYEPYRTRVYLNDTLETIAVTMRRVRRNQR